MQPTRREILAAAAIAPLVLRGPRRQTPAMPRISLAEWSFHRALRGGQMDHLDFAKRAKEEFALEGVEYVNQFFKDKGTDFRYLAEMKKRAEGVGVKSLLIMCDGEGPLASADQSKRFQAVENHFKWI